MKSAFVITAALLGTTLAAQAHADEASPAMSVRAPAAARPISVGAQLELLPMGSFNLKTTAQSQTAETDGDMRSAFGVGGTFAYDLTTHVSLGAAPRLVFGVNVDGGTAKDMTEVDLRARLAVHGHIASNVELYGLIAPGYSWLLPDGGERLGGGAIAFGAGVSVDVTEAFFVNAEMTYQLGAQENPDDHHTDVALHVNYLSLGLGAGTRF